MSLLALSLSVEHTLEQVHAAESLRSRRHRALGEVLLEISTNPGDGRAPAVALRGYGPGCVALALGGLFDPMAHRRLRALGDDVDRWASEELAVDLSQLAGCPPLVSRAVAGMRIRRLVAGARVELHNAPRELVADLGQAPATTFTVRSEAPSVGERR